MLYFDRVCQVIVENKKQIVIENCKIKFEINKSSNAKENTAKIEVYNLGRDTRTDISSEGSSIRILAGYLNNEGLVEIGGGDISKVRHNRDKTEVVTEIYLAEGIQKIKSNPVSFSFSEKSKTTLATILSEITKQSGIAFRILDIDDKQTIEMGYSDCGGIDGVLSNLAENFNFSWSMQNGVVIVKGQKTPTRKEILLLTAKSGLILNPETVKKVSQRLEKSKISTLTKKSLLVQSLLQPRLQIHDVIKIESQDINGLFDIQKINHIGDTRGNDWYSNLEVVPL